MLLKILIVISGIVSIFYRNRFIISCLLLCPTGIGWSTLLYVTTHQILVLIIALTINVKKYFTGL